MAEYKYKNSQKLLTLSYFAVGIILITGSLFKRGSDPPSMLSLAGGIMSLGAGVYTLIDTLATIKADDIGITKKTFFREVRFYWHEISKIKLTSNQLVVINSSRQKSKLKFNLGSLQAGSELLEYIKTRVGQKIES